MTDSDKTGLDSDDEIEILEVIGLDEDSPAARPIRIPPREARSDRDTVIALDDEADPPDDDEARPEEHTAEEAPPGAQQPEERADNDLAIRLAADFEGLSRRVAREREAHERHAAARLIERLLPVLDNFERALGASATTIAPGFRDGIALVFRQMLEELRKEGLTAVDTVGEPFDPNVHEAVATIRDSDLAPHTIVEELQRGYLLHERLLRPALVKVTLDPEGDDGGAGESWEP